MERADVLVIGGGVIGLSVALACAEAGADVVLLSGDAPPASLAAGGMLCPSFEAAHEGGRALARLGAESLALWDGFADRLTGGDRALIDYRRDGVLGVGYPAGFLQGEAVAPPAFVEATGAVLVPGEGQVDPRRLLTALGTRLAELGVRRRAGVARALIEEDAAVLGAKTDGGGVLAGRTILAVGASATGLGLPPGLIVPVRGRAFCATLPGLPAFPGSGVLRAPSVYLCQKADGTLYVGATEELRPAEAVLDGLWLEAGWLVPALRGAARAHVFDGVRPGTPDGLPVIRPDPARAGLFLALGHHRSGVLLAPLTAARAAAWAARP